MSRHTKSDKSFHEKFKSFFKSGLKTQLPDPKEAHYILTTDDITNLSYEAPEAIRIKTMKDLTPAVRDNRLQDHGVELLWVKLQDLLVSDKDSTRHEAMKFFEAVIRGQYNQLGTMKAQFFRLIKGAEQLPGGNPTLKRECDLVYRLNLLSAVTDSGKDIVHFEEEIGRLLLQFFPSVLAQEDSILYSDFMGIVLNVIKFNSTYLDQDVTCALISYISQICVTTNRPQNVSLCLQCLDAIICYSFIPKDGLVTFISTLCLVVNMESQCMDAWKITKNLMGTHLGHSALYSLCQIIQTVENHSNVALIRGAIFFIGMGLWSPHRVKSMGNYTATTILPTFVNALGCKHHLVVQEILMQTERLVTKFGTTLKATSCDSVLCLVELVSKEIPLTVPPALQNQIYAHMHNIITIFEKLSLEKRYLGSRDKLYQVVDLCSKGRPESSILGLIHYRANLIYPTKPTWIRALCDLIEKYYKNETRVSIRIKALSVVMDAYKTNRHIYEEDLLERVILPYLGNADTEPFDTVRLEAVKVLVTVCSESLSRKCFQILEILQRVAMRPLDTKNKSDGKHDDIKFIIESLIKIFCSRICVQPSTLVVQIYELLVQYLEVNYQRMEIFGQVGNIRAQIFRLFMRLRTNDMFNLGVLGSDNVVRFSPYIVVKKPDEVDPGSQKAVAIAPPGNTDKFKMVSEVSLTKACQMVITCLSNELDWRVLKLVLTQVPTVLQNKAILSRYGSSISSFVNPLIELASNQAKYPESLYNTEDLEGSSNKKKLTKADFQNQVYPVLAAIAPYNEYLEKSTAHSLIIALQGGLLSKECNRSCIVALTACVLEMKQTMYVLLPSILLNFSKISATKQVASPMLEFLSTLIHLPNTFSNFFPNDFLSVFAIALNYTNPLRFDPYTVSLAHHVIVMWFLKCRLADRQNFVSFIIKSLNRNLARSIEDGGEFRKVAPSLTSVNSTVSSSRVAAAAQAAVNVTEKFRERGGSLLRQRSASFTDNSGKPKESGSQPGQNATEDNAAQEKWNKFNQELNETCLDLLARYMYANVAVHSRRLPAADFLLKEGQNVSWILGNMIITITTSRCDYTSTRGQLCDRCLLICNSGGGPYPSVTTSVDPVGSTDTKEDAVALGRRRHQSEITSSVRKGLPGENTTDLPKLSLEYPLSGSLDNVDKPKAEREEMSQLEALLKKQQENEQKKPELCACWCTGWAEVHVRRPSGDVSWMTRVQNGSLNCDTMTNFPLADLTTLLQPTMEQDQIAKPREEISSCPLKQNSLSSIFGTQQGPLKNEPGKPGSTCNEECTKQRQSCCPILEDDENEDKSAADPNRRRPSLQMTKSATLSITTGTKPQVRQQHPSGGNAHSPPRTPNSSNGDQKHSSVFFPTTQPKADQFELDTKRSRAFTIAGPPREISQRRGSGSLGSFPTPDPASVQMKDRTSGVSPQFVFLSLYQSFLSWGFQQAEINTPVMLPCTKATETSLRNLDRILAHETHKIGVIYIGPGQASDEQGILNNDFGSLRYTDFLHGLGKLISLHDVDKNITFLGGIDSLDGDGDFAYMWHDDVMQVIYHVATLMPTNREKDPSGNKKKRHIGNNFVAIVYNDTRDGQLFALETIKCQFLYAAVVITPLDQGSNQVEILCKPELTEPLGHVKEPKIVSDRSLSVVVRQMALHCNLAAVIQKSLVKTNSAPYSSNWLERLRAIKRLKEKTLKELEAASSQSKDKDDSRTFTFNDFTQFVLKPS